MRNALIVGGISVVAIGIGVFVFLYGGKAFGVAPSTEIIVPFIELAQGTQSSVSRRTNYLITSESQLDELWNMTDAKGIPPTVDFTKNYVAGVFSGKEPTTGYAITVSKVMDVKSRIVTVTLVSPDTSCILAQSMTAPYQIISLPKTSLPFAHEDQTITVSCK